MKRTRSTKEKRPAKRQRTTQPSFDQRVVKAMRRNADLKTAEQGQLYTYVGSAGQTVSVLATMARGDLSVNSFNGEKIVPERWTVRWAMEAFGVLGSSTEAFCSGRILLVQWLNSGSAPAPGNILDLAGVAGAIAPMAYKKWEGRKKYKILADSGQVFLNIQQDGSGGNGYTASGKFFVPGSKIQPVYFDDGTGRERGDLSVLCISDSAASPGINFAWTSQVVYSDDF